MLNQQFSNILGKIIAKRETLFKVICIVIRQNSKFKLVDSSKLRIDFFQSI